MPTNRKRRTRGSTNKITPGTVRAFKRALELQEHRHLHNDCPDDLYDEYREAAMQVRRDLKVAPWEVSPLDVPSEGPPPEWDNNSAWAASWPKAQALRKQLIEELGAQE